MCRSKDPPENLRIMISFLSPAGRWPRRIIQWALSSTTAVCLSAVLLGAKSSDSRKINEVFAAPNTQSLNGQKIAQVLRKEPGIAASSSLSTDTLAAPYAPSASLMDPLSTATLYETTSTFSTTLDPLTAPTAIVNTTTN